ncbi:MOSC domain-containing protein [Thalassobacillus sp. C254]|uniref:MOSC domain-containing protein n=1 Tax=Thalassobacillus sp. C254 TaxID=1225341 RepID=UPI0006D116BF|nr:MOSC domain-containing protein [Thalassobacillus sp. C254]
MVGAGTVEKGSVVSLNTGKAKKLSHQGEKEILSGIYKEAVKEKALYLSFYNLDGDQQADLVNHGGIDKAVCVYPFEHYKYWKNRFPGSWPSGSFGENVTLQGYTETNTCIGDIFQWGEALVEVAQPRKPCHKLAKRHGIKELPLDVQNTGYTGYYVRVLEEGYVSDNDLFILKNRGSDVSIDFVNQVTYHHQPDQKSLKRLTELPQLTDSWRLSFEKKLKKLEEM